ncbi:hypothetical protein B0H13DRAFT_1983735 [Mycena leptocephala]|nr:hypothetical protein B0H13DRAFT_1983735 [Mycena leptocephala]
MAESNETWALLGDVTNSIQDQREVYEQTKVLTEGRWNEKRVRRQQTELKWIGLWDIMRKIDDDRNRAREARLADESKPGVEKIIKELQERNTELRGFLSSVSESWRADFANQHPETIEAVRLSAHEQVDFNVHGYLDEFSRALASEVRILLGEVGKLREGRRALQHELGALLAMKAAYGAGGEFEPDWTPPRVRLPLLRPGLPQATPEWRTRTTTPRMGGKGAPPQPRSQARSWQFKIALQESDSTTFAPSPSSHDESTHTYTSRGLFGPRAPRNYQGRITLRMASP